MMESINELTTEFCSSSSNHAHPWNDGSCRRWPSAAFSATNPTISCLLIKCASLNVSAHHGMTIAPNVPINWVARLPTDSYNVQRALARTKHGALYIIDKWTLLGESVESNGGLDDSQIQTCYDLLGIEHVYRNGCSRVPPGTDAPGLRALIARQISLHRANLERTLNARSDAEKDMAQLGITRYRDSQTLGLRSDLNRARRRFSWALETLRLLQQGADASSLIDPHTGKPVAAGPPPSAVPDPRPAAAPPSTFTSTGTCIATVTTHTTASGGVFGGDERDVAGRRRGHSEPVGDARLRRARAAANGLSQSARKSTADHPDPGSGVRTAAEFLPILAVVGRAPGFPVDAIGSTARAAPILRRPGVNGASRGPGPVRCNRCCLYYRFLRSAAGELGPNEIDRPCFSPGRARCCVPLC